MTQTLPPLSASVQKQLDRKINELRQKTYLPEPMVNVISELAKLQLRAEQAADTALEAGKTPSVPAASPAIGDSSDETPTDAGHLEGAPLLAKKDFPVNVELAGQLIPEILRVIRDQAPELAPLADEVEAALASGKLLLGDAVKTLLEQNADAAQKPDAKSASPSDSMKDAEDPESCYHEWEKAHPDAPGFLRFVIQSAIMPSVAAIARSLAYRHNNAVVWEHGHCPVCGSLPLVGRLAEAEGARWHSCSFCSFEYRAPRLGCPFCLTGGHDGSQYYVSEDEPGYELDVCGECGNYFKLADFRQFDREWMPLLDDLSSLTLDLYARQMGFRRPTLSAWGF